MCGFGLLPPVSLMMALANNPIVSALIFPLWFALFYMSRDRTWEYLSARSLPRILYFLVPFTRGYASWTLHRAGLSWPLLPPARLVVILAGVVGWILGVALSVG